MQYTSPFAALDLNGMAAFFNTSVRWAGGWVGGWLGGWVSWAC